MKKVTLYPLIVFSCIVLLANCKKDHVVPVNQLAKLPAATQTGANTFGCLVNGQAFLPNYLGPFGSQGLYCTYGYQGYGFFLNIIGSHKNSDGSIYSVNIYADSLAQPIYEGQTINLYKNSVHGVFGEYAMFTSPATISYYTNQTLTGQVNITKLDQIKFFISGTFSFTAIDQNGDKV